MLPTLYCLIAPPSVTFVEGTVTSLQEEDGCVTGLQYKDKATGDVKVRRGVSAAHVEPHIPLSSGERNTVFSAEAVR